ncbi:MAG TPA: CDP-diacylglycerol--serine O-phosphatidyltransferase [Planctomycetota bacterium]|nr:CDP-diacylglycerol--serine O-phosphatidyltransferase [Planctomycetota bacterium]
MRAFRAERRRARLRVIPSLFTLGNAMCGFAAIVQVASLQYANGGIVNPENLAHAGWLVLLAMVFDAIDGRVARMTETTGDFGAELDSLCDAVSFGVAPALMVAMTNARAISSPLFAKMAWLFGLAHACGAILRLARFNVENTHDEEAHLSFKGLPSPAAGGTIVAAVLLQSFFREQHLFGAANFVATLLPFVALATGYLMVSTVRYVHLPNRYLRGRKSVRKIAQIVFLGVIVFALWPEVGLALGFVGFAFSGPIVRAIDMVKARRGGPAVALASPAPIDTGLGGAPAHVEDKSVLAAPPLPTVGSGGCRPPSSGSAPI